MRFGLVAAMAAVTLLSGCEILLDGFGFEMFSKAPIGEAAAMAPEAGPMTDL